MGWWEGTVSFPGVLSELCLVTFEVLNCLRHIALKVKSLPLHTGLVRSGTISLFLPPLFSHQGRVCRVSSAPSPAQPETHSSFPLFSLLLSPIVSSAPEHAWIINLP